MLKDLSHKDESLSMFAGVIGGFYAANTVNKMEKSNTQAHLTCKEQENLNKEVEKLYESETKDSKLADF